MTANGLANQVNQWPRWLQMYWYFVPAPNLQLAIKYALEG